LLLERLMLLAVGAAAAMAAVAYLFTRLSLHPRQMAAQGKTLLQRVIRSIRWRFILLFALSAGLAVVGVLITLPIMHQLHRSRLLRGLLEWLYEVAGLPLIVGYGFALFVLCFFLLTSRTTVYLEEISQVVSRIARGDWSVQVQERFHDELGDLAENINSLSRQLRLAREEEQRAEAAKNELITSVSHDLRTPMTSILGYLDLIVESEPDDSAQWQHYASIARQKAQRLQRLVDGLFEYTRLAYGGLEVQLQDISLSGLLRQLAEEFVPILQRANMQQELQLPEENVWVQADGDLLVRVFENLYSNAIRYGQSAGRMRVVLTTADRVAEVRVENYESPIPEQDLPHVFERLYRVDKSRSEQAGGAGLGLAIAKQIVELHHGQIAVESNQQVTAFIVTLPLQME
jgi:signal transduction histidine kinase